MGETSADSGWGAVVVDHLGREWLRAAQVVERLPEVGVSTLKVWVHRGLIRSRLVGRERWICVQDVASRVAAQRRRNNKKKMAE